MDFATMRRKVDLQTYKTVDEIAADFQLMISNCMTYNPKNTTFYRAAVKLTNQVRSILLPYIVLLVGSFCSVVITMFIFFICFYNGVNV